MERAWLGIARVKMMAGVSRGQLRLHVSLGGERARGYARMIRGRLEQCSLAFI